MIALVARKYDLMRKYFGIFIFIGFIVGYNSCAHAASSSDLFERARNLYDVKDYRSALSLYDVILSSDPRNAEALDFSGWCCRYMGDLSSAEKRFIGALGVLDGEPSKWVHVGLGEAYLQAGLYDKALASFEKARGVASGDSEVILRALKGGVLSCITTDTEKAKGYILEMARIAPEEADALSRDLAVTEKTRTAEPSPAEDRRGATDVTERQDVLLRNDSTSSETASSDVSTKKPTPTEASQPAKNVRKTSRASKKTILKTPAPSVTPTPAERRNTISILGIPLGETQRNVFTKLGEIRIKIEETPSFVKGNQSWFTIEGLGEADTDAAFLERAKSIRTYVVFFQERVLSVVRDYEYGKGPAPMEAFADLEARGTSYLKVVGNISQATRSVTLVEMGSIVSREYAVWLHVRNNLDGSCSVEVQYVYLPLLSNCLSDYKNEK
mgnify:CR=1 FL=1